MARQLDEIIRELDAGYNPSRDLINQRLAALPAQAEAEIGGLKAQEQDYFNNTIMAGARNRGVAFGGIPEGERAQYGASQFLPAVARVRGAQNEARTSLLGALNDVGLDQRRTAMGIYQTEQDRTEQARQFNAQLAAQRDAQARAAATERSPFQSLLGAAQQARQPAAPVQQETWRGGSMAGLVNDKAPQAVAYKSVQKFLSSNDPRVIKSDYEATLRSANYGNAMDKIKIQLYQQARPDLFKPRVGAGGRSW